MNSIKSQILAVITSIRDFKSGIPLIVLFLRTGNVVGVATAIVAEGLGALF